MDIKVLEVQKWLNQTYGGVSGFEKVPENGHTGWPTIYGLREGLQQELKIHPLAQGFGDQTKTKLSEIIGTLKLGYKGKIIKLIKGAFWCKGISPTSFSDVFDKELVQAIKELQEDAGLLGTGDLSVHLMAALFDMSAFVLIPGEGSPQVREMQQYLNRKYSAEIGILPCDGIYQRSTNMALIYALQRVEGMSAQEANGNYGPGTIAKTPTVYPGEIGEIVRIIQYGLYVNGFYTGAFDGQFNQIVADSIVAFRKFMNLPPFTATADLTVIKELLTSNGNTNRDSIALDTATQLTEKDVTNFKNYGFSIIGRYLTGSVGVGKNKKDKYLTLEEIKRITSRGLSIFPIYEDGGYEESYFNSGQGYQDAFTASAAARKLGFPTGTTIYFAVDVDVQNGDIEGTIAPYMQGIISGMSGTEFQPGIYGTRNVCLHGEKLGMKYSFVADMSYGWSGNLGFKMPKNWAFDQFVEYPIGGTPIDQCASSGKDLGSVKFEVKEIPTISPEEALKVIGEGLKGLSSKLTLNHSQILIDEPFLKVSVSSEAEFKGTGSSPTFTIKNGKVDSASLSGFLQTEYGIPSFGADLVVDKVGEAKLTSKITAGNMTIKLSEGSEKLIKIAVIYNIHKVEDNTLSGSLSMTLTFEIDPFLFLKEKVSGLAADVLEKLADTKFTLPIAVIIVLVVLFFIPEIATGVVTGLGAYLLELIPKLING